MESNSHLLEIISHYEILISYRSKLIDIDSSVTQVDLYRSWVESEISGALLKIHKLCWRAVTGNADDFEGEGDTRDEDSLS